MSIRTWIKEPHPILRIIGLSIAFIIVTYASWYFLQAPIIGILFGLSFVVGHLLFKSAWYEGDFVRVAKFFEGRPTMFDFQYMGKDLFEKTAKLGDERPAFVNPAGAPIYVVEKEIMTSDGVPVMVFSYIQGMTKLDLIGKITAFDYTREVAEEAALSYDRVRNLPTILGREYAMSGPMEAVYRDKIATTISLTPKDKRILDFMEDMKSAQDPFHALHKKYLTAEAKARDERLKEMIYADMEEMANEQQPAEE